MNLEKISEKLIPFLKEKELSIYSIRTKRQFGEKIVEILIDVETMDINELEKIHLKFIETLDEDDLDPDYFLELSSLGAERPLNTKDEVTKSIGKYVYLKSSKFVGYGTLLDFKDDIMTIEINDKGKNKHIEIKFDDASKMRRAIKF